MHWPDELPAASDTAVSAIVSKLHALSTSVSLDGAATLVSSARCYEMRLPRETWLDLEVAADVVAPEPFRETGHQLLMRAHAGAGNSAEALWAYERYRKLLSEEPGVDPSRQTKEIHLAVLQGSPTLGAGGSMLI